MSTVAPYLAQTSAGTTTLVTLRQSIADRLNARLPQGQTGASTAAGGLTSFIDLSRTEPDNTLVGTWANWITGPNAGLSRRVLGNVNGEVFLDTPLPVASTVGNTYDLFRRFHPNQFRDAVNYALRNVFPMLYQRFEQEVAEDPTTTLYTYPAGLRELRQLRRRVNPGINPPVYVDLRGEWWEDEQGEVRLHYRPSSGQFLYFIGYGDIPEVASDTDTTTIHRDVVIPGACFYLYQQWGAGEASSSNAWAAGQMKLYEAAYETAKRRYSMPQIAFESHAPRQRIVRGVVADLGPVGV